MATEDVEAEIRAASRTRAGSEREAIARLSEDDAAASSGAATPPAVRASVSTSSSKPLPSSANGAGRPTKSSSSTSASAVPASDIPTSFMQSLGAWWASSESESRESERRLLRRMPFFTDDEPEPERSEGEGEHGRQGAAGNGGEDAVVARIMRVPVGATTTTTTGQGQGSKGWLGGASAGSKSDRYINTLKFTTRAIERKVAETPLAAATTASAANASPRDAVVLLHGYGAGLGFFYLNWTTIARASAAQGMRSYALDWLGMGRSARPSPSELNAGKRASVEERVKKAERFFTDSLEQWRVREGVERMTLIGHSLGGYLSLAYALEYPDRVNRLVLLSPAGIPHGPEDPADGRSADKQQKRSGSESTTPTTSSAAQNAARELTEPQQETQQGATAPVNDVRGGSPAKHGVAEVSSSQAASGASVEKKTPAPSSKDADDGDKAAASSVPDPKGPPRRVRQAITYLWDSGLSPFSLIRGLGPWGPMMVGRYSSRRFGSLSEDDTRDMHHYIWSISRAKGSSEHCISHLLAPGAYARMPMVDRVQSIRVPVTFSYGDRDWMDPQGGIDAIARMKAAGNPNGKVVMIKNAGHHLYLDNAKLSNRFLEEEIAAIRSGM